MGNFWVNLDYFLFQHMVTLQSQVVAAAVATAVAAAVAAAINLTKYLEIVTDRSSRPAEK